MLYAARNNYSESRKRTQLLTCNESVSLRLSLVNLRGPLWLMFLKLIHYQVFSCRWQRHKGYAILESPKRRNRQKFSCRG